MCDRFTLGTSADRLAAAFGLATVPPLAPRYNIAPGQPVVTVGRKAGGACGLVLMAWGRGPRRHLARAEAAHRAPATRDAFQQRRCLIPADGFYAWQVAGLARVPDHVRLVDSGPMAFAGLWDRTDGALACRLLTVPANPLVRHAADRMPAILPPESWDRWLDPSAADDGLRALLAPYQAERMASVVVGPAVNDPANDGPECMRPGSRPGHLTDPLG